ncbi:hypothetical protein SEPCBS57363_003419 [Sporothrix epigloea]|uniref:LysM domain-containing protein n=1 Tax=Sporothrix epigloea TaxID=1892477 RepID=A0ABP0DLC1_9PEZI
MASYCCTCAAPLSTDVLTTSATTASPIPTTSSTTMVREKATIASPQHRQLPCCDRFVCSRCLTKNTRFATYCPYCQIATAPPPSSSVTEENNAPKEALSRPVKDLLPPGLKPPPPYRHRDTHSAAVDSAQNDDAPPPYDSFPTTSTVTAAASAATFTSANEKRDKPVLHYLDHGRDTIASLSLRYNVPADRLRQVNQLTADYLLQARHVIQIPASGRDQRPVTESLSPQPIDDDAESRRKTAIRRFMVACKVVDYDLAVLYLEQTACRRTRSSDRCSTSNEYYDDGCVYDLRAAMEAFEADEQWEKTHPVEAMATKKRKPEKADRKKVIGGSRGFFSR